MASISYTSTYLYISDSSSNVNSIRSSGNKQAALFGVLEPQITRSFSNASVRLAVVRLMADYYSDYDSAIEAADQGQGVKFNIPWKAVATSDSSMLSVSTVRNRLPRPQGFPPDALVFIPDRP